MSEDGAGTRIVKTEGTIGGKPRIEGTRVSVEAVWELYQEGLTPEEIAEEFPTADIDGVKAAIEYREQEETAEPVTA